MRRHNALAMRGVVQTNDGASLRTRLERFDETEDVPTARPGPALVLVHGWSGTSRYFEPLLASAERLFGEDFPSCVLYDQRGHGESSSQPHACGGLSVARLAMDLRHVLDAHSSADGVVLVGTSMGCAVIWSYMSLFSDDDRVKGVVLVDQAPLQNRRPGWTMGSTGCYDSESYARLAAAVRDDMSAFADGNADACLVDATSLDREILRMVKEETLRCDPEALCELMYDHTHQDWRDVCRRCAVPALVLVGRKTKIFPWQGVAHVGDLMPNSIVKFYENEGHWLYLENPDEFARDLRAFVRVHA